MYRGPTEVSYLFIDGAYLKRALEVLSSTFFGGISLPVDYSRLSAGFTKVFHYDCLPEQKADEADADYQSRTLPHSEAFDELRSIRGWHVFEGVVKRKGVRARQKEIDVRIAVDMLTHTHQRNMHRLSFIAGDRDFRPLIEQVVREGMFVELWYSKSSIDRDLLREADARRALDVDWLYGLVPASFHHRHPPVSAQSMHGTDTGAATVISKHSDAKGRQLSLMKRPDGSFVGVMADEYNIGNFVHFGHHDETFLRKYLASRLGISDVASTA